MWESIGTIGNVDELMENILENEERWGEITSFISDMISIQKG